MGHVRIAILILSAEARGYSIFSKARDLLNTVAAAE